jgi:hypothetical protein
MSQNLYSATHQIDAQTALDRQKEDLNKSYERCHNSLANLSNTPMN